MTRSADRLLWKVMVICSGVEGEDICTTGSMDPAEGLIRAIG